MACSGGCKGAENMWPTETTWLSFGLGCDVFDCTTDPIIPRSEMTPTVDIFALFLFFDFPLSVSYGSWRVDAVTGTVKDK